MNADTKRILVVDDNREIHKDFSKILCRNLKSSAEFAELADLFDDRSAANSSAIEVDLDSAYQGEEAIEMVRKSIDIGRPYSLAFVDVRMPPGLDGIETTRRIWEIDPEIQIVICSAYSDYSWGEVVERLMYSDRFLILKKPFENIEVRQLSSALHQRWLDARTDSLTGLINRRAFFDHFLRQTKLAQSSELPLSCVMLDIDFFKRINDQFGHAAGDEALKATAQLLAEVCRQGDQVCRYGGEEFCVLLRGADEASAVGWAERVRKKLRAQIPNSGNTNPLTVTASFGVAQLTHQTQTPEALIELADKSLRIAKQLGRDRVVCHSESVRRASQASQSLTIAQYFDNADATELMQPPHTIEQSATLRDAAEVFIDNKIPSALVVDDQGNMVGILTEGDLLQAFSDSDLKQGPEMLKVRDAMRASVIGFPEDTGLKEIFDFVVRVSIPQVVIVRDGKPRGVIGRMVLLQWLRSIGFGSSPMIPVIDLASHTENNCNVHL